MLNISIIREMQTKATMWLSLNTHLYGNYQNETKQNSKNHKKMTSDGEDVEKLEPLFIAGRNVK